MQAFYGSDAEDGAQDSDADLSSLRWRLIRALRDGSQALDDDSLKSYLRNAVVNQVAIDQPRYSGFKQAQEIDDKTSNGD